MNLKHAAVTLFGFSMLGIAAAGADEIYSGEPFAEALHDLNRCADLVAHELSSASARVRTDVFRLRDGRLIAVTSRAKKLGEVFTVETLRVTSAAQSALTKRLPSVSSVPLPK